MGRVKATGEAPAGRGSSSPGVTTDRRLVSAALALLDAGGEEAVTMRAVGHACGLSHNASYKHFASRKALMAAVATAEFNALSDRLEETRSLVGEPAARLSQAIDILVGYSAAWPARYRLLFVANPASVADDEALARAAGAAFAAFRAIVADCQAQWRLTSVSDTAISGLLLATLQGLVAQEANGRTKAEKGQAGVRSGMALMIQLLSNQT